MGNEVKYRLQIFSNGKKSISDLDAGESMHSSIGPWEEANSLYIEPSNLVSLLTKPPSAVKIQRTLENRRSKYSDSVVIYDVGMGVAANALAAIQTFLKCSVSKSLRIISFEINLKGIQFALQLQNEFSFLDEHSSLIGDLLVKRKVQHSHPFLPQHEVTWELHEGDFRKLIHQCPEPDLIFFDLYSPKQCPELWGFHSFDLLFKKTESHRTAGLPTGVFTYSSSTCVRSSMLLAGFHVGRGGKTEAKRETTVANTQPQLLKEPLSQSWYEHLCRSSKPLPLDHPFTSSSELAFQAIKARLFLS